MLGVLCRVDTIAMILGASTQQWCDIFALEEHEHWPDRLPFVEGYKHPLIMTDH